MYLTGAQYFNLIIFWVNVLSLQHISYGQLQLLCTSCRTRQKEPEGRNK